MTPADKAANNVVVVSFIGIDAIWQLSFGCLLMRTIASCLRYTGYLNFINGPISLLLLLMFLFCLVFAMSLSASVYMCFVVTCWERADLLALVCGV